MKNISKRSVTGIVMVSTRVASREPIVVLQNLGRLLEADKLIAAPSRMHV
jgi:hypothetical protein